jgi:hypothetical protein
MSFLDDYAPVEDRLREFWEQHPYGRVITELLHADHEAQDYIVRAEVYFGNELRNDPPTASGLAHDSAAMLSPNLRHSALEICETSAIGRALANANFAAKGKRPSREEMAKNSAGASRHAAPPAEQRPEPDTYGEGVNGSGATQVTGGEAVTPLADVTAPASSSVPEPHDHVAGPRKLASGKVLCSLCGRSFKPAPTIHTAPIEPEEERLDLA